MNAKASNLLCFRGEISSPRVEVVEKGKAIGSPKTEKDRVTGNVGRDNNTSPPGKGNDTFLLFSFLGFSFVERRKFAIKILNNLRSMLLY